MGNVVSRSVNFNDTTEVMESMMECRDHEPIPRVPGVPVTPRTVSSETVPFKEVIENPAVNTVSGAVVNQNSASNLPVLSNSVSISPSNEPETGTDHQQNPPGGGGGGHLLNSNDPVLPAFHNLQTVKIENHVEAAISLAPREKWSEPDNMEDGEISGSDDGNGTTNFLSLWQEKRTGDKSWSSMEGKQHAPKRRRLSTCGDDGDSSRSSKSTGRSSKNHKTLRDDGIRKDHKGYSFDTSRLSKPDPPNHQRLYINSHEPVNVSQNKMILARRGPNKDEIISDDLILVPLFREVIDSERKKKAELEDENKHLKLMLTKASAEKEETFELLRKSNQTLKRVTDSSIDLTEKVTGLKAQLAEKDLQIKNLRKDASLIRTCVSRMNRTFDQIELVGNPPLPNGNEEARTESNHRQGPNVVRVFNMSSTSHQELKIGADTTNKITSKMITPAAVKFNKPDYNSEEFILSRLADLNKWRFSLKDIKKVDGRFRCPECGDEKQTLSAAASHARDKHVWRLGAGLPSRCR